MSEPSKPMSKIEFSEKNNHKTEERTKYLGLTCNWCPYERMICPSCSWRYDKLMMINKLLDGQDNWDDFKDTDEKKRLVRSI